MAERFNKTGLHKNARSSGSISNAEHHDPSSSGRNMNGSPATPESFFNDAVEHAIHPSAVLRVFNTLTTIAYIYIGEAPAPVIVDATNGFALAPQMFECFYCGVSNDDQKSIVCKTSSGSVQVVLMKP